MGNPRSYPISARLERRSRFQHQVPSGPMGASHSTVSSLVRIDETRSSAYRWHGPYVVLDLRSSSIANKSVRAHETNTGITVEHIEEIQSSISLAQPSDQVYQVPITLATGRQLYPASKESEQSYYERVGFFELEWQSKGIYLPFEAFFAKDLTRHPRRVPPDMDPYGVFKDREPRRLRLY